MHRGKLAWGIVGILLAGATPAAAAQQASVLIPRSGDAPGYQLRITTARLGISVSRDGEQVLRTAPDAFTFAGGVATRVRSVVKQGDTLVAEADSTAGKPVTLRLTPKADRFELSWSVGGETPGDRATHFDLATSGHWYGGGETSEGKTQPYPLSAGVVDEPEFSPASYMMQEPYFSTSKSVGVFVRTAQPMKVALANGRADLAVTGSAEFSGTVFVESSRRAVYDDYIGEVGKPQKSDATDAEYASPLWNSWAQYYRNIDQDKVVAWARDLKAAHVAGHTVQLDDKWESNYGNLTFDAKTFPDPKKLVDDIHGMGQKFGLWTTFWINLDSANYAYARDHGYLLRAKTGAEPCTVKWWNGTAGIIDLGNPQARDWYTGNLRALMANYGVDGFKFDTRFFDDSCATSNGLTPQDYQRLGARHDRRVRPAGRRHPHALGHPALRLRDPGGGRGHHLGRPPHVRPPGLGHLHRRLPLRRDGHDRRLQQRTAAHPGSAGALGAGGVADAADVLLDVAGGHRRHHDRAAGDLRPAGTAERYADAVRTHAKLAGYLKTQVNQAVADGTPIMRPVFFDFPRDHRFDTIDDEWLLGPALLAAPMISAGTSRDVVLPAGLWFDPHTKRVELGGRTLHGYAAPLDVTPMFVRLGAPGAAGLVAALSR